MLHWHQQQRPAWFSRAFCVPYLLTMPCLHKGLQSQLVGRIAISWHFVWKRGDMLWTGQLLKAAESPWINCLKHLNKLLVSDPVISPQYSQWELRVWICCSLSGHSLGLANRAFWQPFNFGRQNSSSPDSQKKKTGIREQREELFSISLRNTEDLFGLGTYCMKKYSAWIFSLEMVGI